MRRKIIKQGHNTLTITLPTKWAKKHGLSSGDEIDIQENEKSLIISGSKAPTLAGKNLDLRDVSTIFLWRSIISAYRAGYDEITVRFSIPKGTHKNAYTGFGFNNLQLLFSQGVIELSPIEAIQALVNRLIGVEIIDQKENYCVIKDMSETTYKEFDNSLRRIFLLLMSMSDECYECYKTNRKEPLRSIHLIDTNIDRFEDFCLRVLNKIGYKDYNKTSIVHSIIFLLELVGDEYKKIALHCLDMKGKPRELMTKEFQIQKVQLRRFYELFYRFSKEKVGDIYNSDIEGDKFLKENFVNFSNAEKEIIHHFKKIGVYVLSLTELMIDLEG